MSCSGEWRGLNQKRGMRKTEQSKPPERIETIEIRARKILKSPAGDFKKTRAEDVLKNPEKTAENLKVSRGRLFISKGVQEGFKGVFKALKNRPQWGGEEVESGAIEVLLANQSINKSSKNQCMISDKIRTSS